MKTKIISLMMFILLISSCTATKVSAQRTVVVEPAYYDISYDLDLEAVASIFGESVNLEDFEKRLNRHDYRISNLDLNGDGYIDYLRVIETTENRVHLVVIQAVLGRNVFQDVATIVVEQSQRNRAYVQIIGDPYIYGYNYIVEPIYVANPPIYRWFWRPRRVVWVSPYYWGYYPVYYQYYRPVNVNVYITNIHQHVNYRNNYRYTSTVRNSNVGRMQSSVRRNDYATSHPDRAFSQRNSSRNVSNKREIQTRTTDETTTRSSSTNRQGTSTSTRTSTENTNRTGTTTGTSSGTTRQSTTQQNGTTTNSGRTTTNSNNNSSRNNTTTNNRSTTPRSNSTTDKSSSSSSSTRSNSNNSSSSVRQGSSSNSNNTRSSSSNSSSRSSGSTGNSSRSSSSNSSGSSSRR